MAEKALANFLDPAELAVVDPVSQKYKELMKVGCTGCGYCLSCPEGVSIPGCFEAYKKLHLFCDAEEAKPMYAVRMSGMLKTATTPITPCVLGAANARENAPSVLKRRS